MCDACETRVKGVFSLISNVANKAYGRRRNVGKRAAHLQNVNRAENKAYNELEYVRKFGGRKLRISRIQTFTEPFAGLQRGFCYAVSLGQSLGKQLEQIAYRRGLFETRAGDGRR